MTGDQRALKHKYHYKPRLWTLAQTEEPRQKSPDRRAQTEEPGQKSPDRRAQTEGLKRGSYKPPPPPPEQSPPGRTESHVNGVACKCPAGVKHQRGWEIFKPLLHTNRATKSAVPCVVCSPCQCRPPPPIPQHCAPYHPCHTPPHVVALMESGVMSSSKHVSAVHMRIDRTPLKPLSDPKCQTK